MALSNSLREQLQQVQNFTDVDIIKKKRTIQRAQFTTGSPIVDSTQTTTNIKHQTSQTLVHNLYLTVLWVLLSLWQNEIQ